MSRSMIGRLPMVAWGILNGDYKRYGAWAKAELRSDLRTNLQVDRIIPQVQPGRIS